MKRVLCVLLAAMLALSVVACGQPAAQPTTTAAPTTAAPAPTEAPTTAAPTTAAPAPTEAATTAAPAPTEAPTTVADAVAALPTFEGKIAIVTSTVDQNEEEYRSAQDVIAKYGADKIVHETWPANFMQEQEQMISTVSKIGSDPAVKVLILNQSVPGCNAAVDKLFETRNDMFIVYCTPQENPADVSERANLIIIPDELGMGYAMPEQAAKMGAKVFVHYSFPRHMAQVLLSGRREILKSECARLGIEFVDATAPDPTSDAGVTGAQQFILEDVPKMLAQYGKDTAFFSTNCAMQIPLIKAISDGGGIYPQPCCPSPFHGYPTALGIEGGTGDMAYVISETNRILGEKGVLGRFSTWPVPAAMMATGASVEYAIKWLNGEVPQEGIDVEVLKQCMKDYSGVDISITAYEENGVTYDNFLMPLMGYLTYDG